MGIKGDQGDFGYQGIPGSIGLSGQKVLKMIILIFFF